MLRDPRYLASKPAVSQWVSKTYLCDSLPEFHGPYLQGHYVPCGPRASWTEPQYIIYKEEQAKCKKDRLATRLHGLESMLNCNRAITMWENKGCTSLTIDDDNSIVARLQNIIPPTRPLASNTQRVVNERDDESLEQMSDGKGAKLTLKPPHPDGTKYGSSEIEGRSQAC